MNKIKHYTFLFSAIGFLSLATTSCSDDDDPITQADTQQEMAAITQQYIKGTVNNTYKYLAEETGNLYDQLEAATAKFENNTLTQQDVNEICETFIKARAYYESSEAFLFGAATDFGIDPHIDTWPLDANALAVTLKNTDLVNHLKGEDGIAWAGTNLGQGCLGFHGIEFVLFRNGAYRTLAALKAPETDAAFTKISANVTGLQELIYATAVAGDLRDRCWQMEVSWNEKAPKAHIDRVEECELPYTINGSEDSYGANFLNAGNAGSTYKTLQAALSTILVAGCENIAKEVASTKIGNPYSGEDVNYIESPYSQRSFIDFEDNLLSIQNSLYGGRADDKSRDESKSIIQYMKDHQYSGVDKLESDLKAAINALKECQQLEGGFVNNIKNDKVGKAQNAINAVDEDLTAAAAWIVLQ